jgi:hypothetical protein
MNENVKWTYLCQEEIAKKLAEKGIKVSVFTVRTLLKIHQFKKRKINKCATIVFVKYSGYFCPDT